MRKLIILAVLLVWTSPYSRAQELSETIASVGEEYARGYLAPLMDAFGANLNAGLVPAARWGKPGNEINVYVGFKVFGAFVPQSGRTFSTTYVADIPFSQNFGSESVRMNIPAEVTIEDAPSFFGDSEPGEMTIRAQSDTSFTYLGLVIPVSIDITETKEGIGGLLNLGVAPFLVPEVVLGTYLGTDVMVRWVPRISVENTESIYLIGLGVRHSLNPYLPNLPFDVAVQTVWQRAGADDDDDNPLLRVSTFAANMQIGKRIGILGMYAALQSEQSSADVRYDYVPDSFEPGDEPTSVRFSLAAANKMRGIFGVGVNLGMLHLNADVGLGRTKTISAGLGLAY